MAAANTVNQQTPNSNEGTQIGPLIRLWGIKTHQLPPTSGDSGNNTQLAHFLTSLLQEAIPFISSIAPPGPTKTTLWKPKGTKTYRPASTAPVELYERVIGRAELKGVSDREVKGTVGGGGETWVCRRSVHEDGGGPGTACWEEFRRCFKEEHAETEELFTPSVVGMRRGVVWDCGGVPPQTISSSTYHAFTLCLLSARHRVGKPLKDRTFPILQMTCSAMDSSSSSSSSSSTKEKPEFFVISVTVPDYFTSSFYQDSNTTGKEKEKDTVIASYASIERIRKIPVSAAASGQGQDQDGDGNNDTDTNNGRIEWLMALTSDAGGILPRWVQNLAVPGQIAKDVPLFLGWIAKERARRVGSIRRAIVEGHGQ